MNIVPFVKQQLSRIPSIIIKAKKMTQTSKETQQTVTVRDNWNRRKRIAELYSQLLSVTFYTNLSSHQRTLEAHNFSLK